MKSIKHLQSGDIVLLRKDLKVGEMYGHLPLMKGMSKVDRITVDYVSIDSVSTSYQLHYFYSKEMLLRKLPNKK